MAGYQYLKGNPKPHRFIVKRKGHGIKTKTFIEKVDGERWARELERSFDIYGMPLTHDNLKNKTVREIVEQYLNEVTPRKASADNETPVLKKFLRSDPMAAKSLAFVDKQDAYRYRDKRLKDTWRGPNGNWSVARPIAPTTVRREIATFHHIFEVAKEEWGFTNLTNPFSAIKISGTKGRRRKRRLKDGELERLQEACKTCLGLNRLYVPLAIYLALETGMRLQEIFNLTWADLTFDKRRIEIRKSKTDHISDYKGRTIVMPLQAMWVSEYLKRYLAKEDTFNETDLIFPNTIEGKPRKEAFKQSWADVKKRAKITDLTFHDLRHEAGSRFDEAGLTKAENELMLGHEGQDTNSRYIHAKLINIQDKLDAHHLEKSGGTGLVYLRERKIKDLLGI